MHDISTPSSPGSLIVVGTGIQLAGQITVEAANAIRAADKVFYLVSGDVTAHWLASLNPTAETLTDSYGFDRRRRETYAEMAERIVAQVRAGRRVCAAFYGHPGIFVNPAHEAIRRARAEGYHAEMLPGVSAIDCLFADLAIDPATSGCQIFEASDFLLRHRIYDAASVLILLQVGAMGVSSARRPETTAAMAYLARTLGSSYPPEHEVILYMAARYPIEEPTIRKMPLEALAEVIPDPRMTLVVPPARVTPSDRAVANAIKSI